MICFSLTVHFQARTRGSSHRPSAALHLQWGILGSKVSLDGSRNSRLSMSRRTSAVYGAFFFIGTLALGALRAYIPKLTLLSIFGSIVLDIVRIFRSFSVHELIGWFG